MDANTVRELPLFEGLPEEVVDDCARRFEELELLAGTGLAREGDFAYKFFVVLDGEVEVQRDFTHVATLGPGDFFGEMALFDDEPRSATCVAASSCTLLVLDRGRFYGLIEQMPQLGLAICKTLSQRLRRTERDLRAAHTAKTA